MSNLYLLQGSDKDGIRNTFVFFANSDRDVVNYVLYKKFYYQVVLDSIGRPDTYQKFISAIESSCSDDDSRIWWILQEFDLDDTIDLR